MAGRSPVPFEVRFWEKVDRTGGDNACWPWLAATSGGHGLFRISTQVRSQAHRVAYELLVGPIPSGLDLDHMCHNEDDDCRGGKECLHRRCVNPAHLEPATRRENLLRGKTLPAAHAAATGCPRGHSYTPENTYLWRGMRSCKECRRANNRAWLAANRSPKAA